MPLVCRKTVKGMCYEFMCRCSVRNEVVDALCRLRHARLCPMNFGSTGSIRGPYMSLYVYKHESSCKHVYFQLILGDDVCDQIAVIAVASKAEKE